MRFVRNINIGQLVSEDSPMLAASMREKPEHVLSKRKSRSYGEIIDSLVQVEGKKAELNNILTTLLHTMKTTKKNLEQKILLIEEFQMSLEK